MGRVIITKKRVAILLAAIAAGTTTVLIARSFSGPAYGTVSLATVSSDETEPLKETINGTRVSFDYPSRYEQASNQNPSASLEYWILVARQGLGIGQAGQVSLSVSKMPTGGVKEDSAYKQFHAFTDKYENSESTLNNEPIFIASRVDPSFERTVLWPHGDYLLSSSLTSATEDEKLINEFDELLRSVVWQP